MTSAFWVDTDHVKKNAPKFEDVGSAVADIHKTLTSKLDAEGDPFEDDSPYKQGFEEKYKDPKKQADDYFTNVAKSIKQIGEGLLEMAQTYDKGDQASHTKFS